MVIASLVYEHYVNRRVVDCWLAERHGGYDTKVLDVYTAHKLLVRSVYLSISQLG